MPKYSIDLQIFFIESVTSLWNLMSVCCSVIGWSACHDFLKRTESFTSTLQSELLLSVDVFNVKDTNDWPISRRT